MLLSVAATYTATLLTGTSPQPPAAALTAGYRLTLAITAGLSAIGAVIAALTLRPSRLSPTAQAQPAAAGHHPQLKNQTTREDKP